MSKYVRVHPSVNGFKKKRSSKRERFSEEEGHGRVPRTICSDELLSDYDLRVFTSMAILERNKGIVTAGMRTIAETAQKSLGGTHNAIERLATRGFVEIVRGRNGQRASYRLTSPVFQYEATNKPKRPSLRPCSKCGLDCVPNKTTGWCKPCISAAREDRRQAGIRAIESARAAG